MWHGTRLVNIPTILDEGLQLSPVDGRGTNEKKGGFFGYGLYFSPCFSKAARFSAEDCDHVTREGEYGAVFLCEVDLGRTLMLIDEDVQARRFCATLPDQCGKSAVLALTMCIAEARRVDDGGTRRDPLEFSGVKH